MHIRLAAGYSDLIKSRVEALPSIFRTRGVAQVTYHRRVTHYERAPFLVGSLDAGAVCGGFAPAPPGFSALVPLPIGSLCEQIVKGGCRSIPLHRSRPLSRRSGCFPAWPYSIYSIPLDSSHTNASLGLSVGCSAGASKKWQCGLDRWRWSGLLCAGCRRQRRQ